MSISKRVWEAEMELRANVAEAVSHHLQGIDPSIPSFRNLVLSMLASKDSEFERAIAPDGLRKAAEELRMLAGVIYDVLNEEGR